MDCIDVLLSMHEGNAFWYHRGKLNTEGWDQDVVMECSTYHLTFMSSSCNSDTCPNCHITRHTSDFTPSAHSFHHQFFELHLQWHHKVSHCCNNNSYWIRFGTLVPKNQVP